MSCAEACVQVGVVDVWKMGRIFCPIETDRSFKVDMLGSIGVSWSGWLSVVDLTIECDGALLLSGLACQAF